MTKRSAALLWDEPATKDTDENCREGGKRQALRIAALLQPVSGPELYTRLDIRRRRAQIRARRALDLR